MDPFHTSKRSSVSFAGTTARTSTFPNTYEYNSMDNLQYDTPGNDNNDDVNGTYDTYDPTTNNHSALYSNRSPMYSPLDYSKNVTSPGNSNNNSNNNSYMAPPSFSALQQHQTRAYNLIYNNSNNNNTSMVSNRNIVCEWESPAPLYAMDWSMDDLICLGSYKEDSRNKLQIIRSADQLNWDKVSECATTYPVSKVQWLPNNLRPRQLATCSDSLRIWSLNDSDGSLQEQINLSLCKYNKQHGNSLDTSSTDSTNKILGGLPPITSFDWNPIETNLIISCSIDTTCIVWDLNSSNFVKTQLIAHDSEVYDVRFLTKSTQIFASCGGDGSVRIFDLRSLAHSTIIYEPTANAEHPNLDDPTLQNHALLRLEPSPSDPNILATFVCDSNSIMILDMRNPESPVLTLDGHSGSINQIKWHPTKRNILMSCGDDCQVLCWDLNKYLGTGSPTATVSDSNGTTSTLNKTSQDQDIDMSGDNKKVDMPSFHYSSGTEEINNIAWRPDNGNWLGTVSGKTFKNIRVY
ncbi:similar to Saccharomyces cerevisiae YPL247C Putative protein of unknown function [Maudiozyma saulgeensis]|uniref:Uncharacterized protein n=1 Tax=Maudiozyma saulgeensis TaxID=1789683 RepID=A0A1X7R7E6_9SACH|nr:similar to Saccharomyces cerevisiae YPL247C Putative protein of unknown function [Kazachstania saulgeensis]